MASFRSLRLTDLLPRRRAVGPVGGWDRGGAKNPPPNVVVLRRAVEAAVARAGWRRACRGGGSCRVRWCTSGWPCHRPGRNPIGDRPQRFGATAGRVAAAVNRGGTGSRRRSCAGAEGGGDAWAPPLTAGSMCFRAVSRPASDRLTTEDPTGRTAEAAASLRRDIMGHSSSPRSRESALSATAQNPPGPAECQEKPQKSGGTADFLAQDVPLGSRLPFAGFKLGRPGLQLPDRSSGSSGAAACPVRAAADPLVRVPVGAMRRCSRSRSTHSRSVALLMLRSAAMSLYVAPGVEQRVHPPGDLQRLGRIFSRRAR